MVDCFRGTGKKSTKILVVVSFYAVISFISALVLPLLFLLTSWHKKTTDFILPSFSDCTETKFTLTYHIVIKSWKISIRFRHYHQW
ncbi:hypothetical protein WUBG_16337 [Wuchereria bancrofti]|uniref:Uncharacterized protein n=1 Tax=Wuchereria bancrofti TaxID=6293 RepID=J9AFC8_WUCBA|nr:hypothetical protein WUBG_16337 [Wuchereria bancrofti]